MKEREEDRANRRVRWLIRFGLLWAIGLGGRLVQLQIFEHDQLAREAQRQQTREVSVLMPRGAILDAQDVPLAMSVPGESVCLNPRRTPNVEMTARVLSNALHLDYATLRDAIADAKSHDKGFLRIAPGVKPDQVERLKALGWDWVEFRPESHRVYPAGPVAAHVIGGVDHEQRGYAGAEKSLNGMLSGHTGQMLVTMDSKQRGFESEVSVPAQAGQSIPLTIDRRIQYLSERLIAEAVKKNNADNGSIVVMNPHTGAVLAIANYPSFDPNVTPRGGADLKLRQNLAVEAPFEPGSVFKVVTIAAALELGRVTPETIVDCGMGQMTLHNRVIRDHVRHGVIPVREVLAQSSNIGSIKIALMVGKERFHEYIKRFGFGDRTGIELPSESRGRVFPPARWGATSIGSVAMGHEMMATSLHLAQLASTIANGGRRVRPTILRQPGQAGTVHADNAMGEQVIRPETAIKMKAMMEGVVVGDHGTGHAARLDGYSSAGKTGSAQMLEKYVLNGKTKWRYSHSKYHASFMGFTPVNNPALTIVVTINGATRLAGAAAAPVFREVAQPALRMLDIPKDLPDRPRALPSPTPEPASDLAIADLSEPAAPEAEDESAPLFIGRRTPDFRGLSMRDAVARANELNLDIEIHGSGVVRKQTPTPAAPLKEGTKVRLDFSR